MLLFSAKYLISRFAPFLGLVQLAFAISNSSILLVLPNSTLT
jgi:hypothetical protein